MTEKRYIKLWLKFKPDYATTPSGTVIHKNEYKTLPERKRIINRFIKMIINEDYFAGKIWQARIYDTVDNSELYLWRSQIQDYETNQV